MSARGSLLLVTVLLAGPAVHPQTPRPADPPPAREPRPAPSQAAGARPIPKPPAPPVLEGTVRGPDRKPIEKALVIARPATPEPTDTPVSTRTDADGRFRLTLRVRQPHRVRAEAPGLAGRTLKDVAPGTAVAIDLTAGGTIEGVVRDGETGQPAPGVRVETADEDAVASPGDPDVGRIRATTDANGRFRLAGLGPGRHSVTARARGRGHAARHAVALGARVELTLEPTATLYGQVTGPDGAPVAGAIVTPVGVRNRTSTDSAPTDAQGRYEVIGLAGGVYDLAVRASGLAPGVVPDVFVEARGEAQADVTLRPGARVTGRLVDGAGKPLAGRVHVGEIGGHPTPYVLADLLGASAGADGRFTLEAVPTGDHALGAEARGQAAQRVEFGVSAAQKQVDLGDVRMETGLVIRGRVRTAGGDPVADAFVEGNPRRARVSRHVRVRTEADGMFALAGLEPMTHHVAAAAAGFGRAEADLEPGGEPVELVLEPGSGIVGRVVDDRGNPIDSFRVVARNTVESRPWAWESFDAVDGRFELKDVSPGSYVVSVEAPERAPGTASVDVSAKGPADVGTVKLGPGTTLRGTVVDKGGAPVPGAHVLLVRRTQHMVVFGRDVDVISDRAGAFEAKGVAPGPVDVTATHPSYARATPVPVVVDKAQAPPEVRLVMDQGGRIEGSLRRRDGSGIPGVLMNVTTTGEPGLNEDLVATEADGSFTIEHVPAGRARVTAMAPASRGTLRSAQSREVDVRDGETARLDLVNREILLTGRVTRSGTPAPGLRLEALGDRMMSMGIRGQTVASAGGGPERMTAVTREDGGFEMIVDEPGVVRVTASSLDGRMRLPVRVLRLPDVETHTIELNFDGVPVSGIVVDQDTEAPIAYAEVFASAKTPQRDPGGSGTAGPDGRFQLELEPAAYRVGARDREGRYANGDVEATVGPGGANDLRIALPRSMRIAGRVLDPGGQPLPGVALTAGGEGPRSGGFAESLADGSFEVRGLRSGDYTLSAFAPAGLFAIRPRVAAGTLGVSLSLQPGGRVRVQTVSADGRPIAGAWARVGTVDGLGVPGLSGSREPTDAQGLTELPVPFGRVTVVATAQGLSGLAPVQVAPGEAAAVRIVMEAR
jgi:protocatechuate 3,4-dioxygenase beta subunit